MFFKNVDTRIASLQNALFLYAAQLDAYTLGVEKYIENNNTRGVIEISKIPELNLMQENKDHAYQQLIKEIKTFVIDNKIME